MATHNLDDMFVCMIKTCSSIERNENVRERFCFTLDLLQTVLSASVAKRLVNITLFIPCFSLMVISLVIYFLALI